MPNVTLQIQLTDAERAGLEAAAAAAVAAVGNPDQERRARILADRVRALDQIKRLYAVVLGFALTTGITNAYLCERALDKFSWEAGSIVVAPVISSASLMVLFALGAERFLDRRYLQPDSPVATRWSLFIDLFTLGLTAAWFVILSNIFQAPPPNAPRLSLGELRGFQAHFIKYLVVFYLLDIFCLAINLFRGRADPEHRRAHWIWIWINAACAVLLFLANRYISDMALPLVGFSLIATLLTAIHMIRFAVDYRHTFKFYYPLEAI